MESNENWGQFSRVWKRRIGWAVSAYCGAQTVHKKPKEFNENKRAASIFAAALREWEALVIVSSPFSSGRRAPSTSFQGRSASASLPSYSVKKLKKKKKFWLWWVALWSRLKCGPPEQSSKAKSTGYKHELAATSERERHFSILLRFNTLRHTRLIPTLFPAGHCF